MAEGIQRYAAVVGEDVIDHLYQLAGPLRGKKVVHVNSTRVGGGVAEILAKLVPLMQELGIDTSWEVITGEDKFYQCTKNFHNGLQGSIVDLPPGLLKAYEETNARNAEELRPTLEAADIVIIHDPQPAPLITLCPNRKGKWVWRCHIDVSRPFRPVWRYLRNYVSQHDASIFSLADFAQPLPHTQYLISPSIDPLAEKNIDLPEEEIQAVLEQYGIDPEKPMVVQVSRFDRFKDPVGVIRAYQLATRFIPSLQLVLAGGEATDDPEGAAVLEEVRAAAGDDPSIFILLLPADANRTINALQRAAQIVLQKSIREGFGLTVTEGLWKGKPVIGGNTGGIRLQVRNHQTGFLVDSPEGAAMRIRYLLHHRSRLEEIGYRAKEFVRENFLLTRHLREYLTLMLGLTHAEEGRIDLG
ncbi:MAG: glycosyltransferase [Candidatus Eisenbacteria sp.]|nr:glycosyltransferase [Candidatus Eisenbacteria bacterium]